MQKMQTNKPIVDDAFVRQLQLWISHRLFAKSLNCSTRRRVVLLRSM